MNNIVNLKHWQDFPVVAILAVIASTVLIFLVLVKQAENQKQALEKNYAWDPNMDRRLQRITGIRCLTWAIMSVIAFATAWQERQFYFAVECFIYLALPYVIFNNQWARAVAECYPGEVSSPYMFRRTLWRGSGLFLLLAVCSAVLYEIVLHTT